MTWMPLYGGGIVIRRRWINFIGALSILDVTPDGNS